MLRKLTYGTLVIGLVILGLVAQAGSHLLGLPSQELQSPDAGSPGGPHTVGIRHLSNSETPLRLTIWYPAVASDSETSLTYSYGIKMFSPNGSLALATYQGRAVPSSNFDLTGGPYPLVVLSHGFAITPSSYSWLAEHLASQGMVVVAPHHHESLDPGVLWKSTIQRPTDVLVVLTWLDREVQLGGALHGLVDTETVAVVGHSLGGYTALAAAGARLDTTWFSQTCQVAEPLAFMCDAVLPRVDDMADLAGHNSVPSGLWPSVADRRIDAVVSIAGDAALFGSAGLAEVTVPVMAIGGTADVDTPFEWGTELTYEHVASENRVEIGFEDAAHMLFAGKCENARRIMSLVPLGFCSDTWDRYQAHDLIKRSVSAFLIKELTGEHVAQDDLRSSFGVTYRAEGE